MSVAAPEIAVAMPDRWALPRWARRSSPRRNAGVAAFGGAVLPWALWPVLAAWAWAVPPFLLLAIALAGGFLLFAARSWLAGQRMSGLFAVPQGWGAGLFGLVASHLLWLLALRLAIPGEAPVAWPVLSAAFGGVAPGAAGSVAALLALGGLLCWLAGADARRSAEGLDPLARLCGLAAPICALLHLCLEPRVELAGASLLAMAALALAPLAIAGALRRVTAGWPAAAFSAARRRGAAGR